ncbi:MAG: hypothetical protein WBL45_12965 [Solirubrobacterales bacterium]
MRRNLPRNRGPRLTYANVMSTLAVFLVFAGGTAIAANLPKNSVNSKKVKNNTLQSIDLADGTGVSGADVADGSLGGTDLADGSLGGADLADGSLGGNELTDGSVAGADLGGGAGGRDSLRADSVDSSSLIVGTIQGADVGASAVRGVSIDESTLGEVASALEFDNRRPSSYLTIEGMYPAESPVEEGARLGDGTVKISQRCKRGDVLLGGGAANLSAGSGLMDNGPQGGAWTVQLRPAGGSDPFSVVVLCAQKALP